MGAYSINCSIDYGNSNRQNISITNKVIETHNIRLKPDARKSARLSRSVKSQMGRKMTPADEELYERVDEVLH